MNHAPPRFQTQAIAATAEQLAIQASAERSLLIVAAAGAAKTTTLALRLCEAVALGADPRRLLALAYTDTACTALRRALRRLCADAPALGPELEKVSIETFDSYAAGVLRRHELIEGKDPVPRYRHAEQAKRFVWDAVAAASANPRERFQDDLQMPAQGTDSFVGNFLRRGQSIKGRLLLELNPPEGGDDPAYAAETLGLDYSLLRIHRQYERQRRDTGRGHAAFRLPLDATYDLARLLRSDEIDSPAELPLGAWRGVFVDEMHDCNEAMFTVLRALLGRADVWFCGVGDRDQVIHQDNGADARFMSADLDAELGRSVRRLPLTVSFRYGASLARWMSQLTAKKIAAAADRQTALQRMKCGGPATPTMAEGVAAALKAWRGEQRRDLVYRDCAVLLRHASQSIAIENELHQRGIAYRCEGFASYLHRPEVLFVRCAYAVASGRLDTLGGADTRRLIPDALFEITQAPVLAAEDSDFASAEAFLREARTEAAASEQVVARIFSEHVMAWASAAVRQRLQKAMAVAQGAGGAGCKFADFLAALDMPRFAQDAYVDRERRDEVQRHMQGLLAASRQFAGALAFFGFLQQLDEAQETRQRELAGGLVRSNKRHATAITLAAAEHVKGLEFEHVVLPFLEHGVFPDAHAALSDERNLFYVAATRARAKLSLLVHELRPSPFVPAAAGDRPRDS